MINDEMTPSPRQPLDGSCKKVTSARRFGDNAASREHKSLLSTGPTYEANPIVLRAITFHPVILPVRLRLHTLPQVSWWPSQRTSVNGDGPGRNENSTSTEIKKRTTVHAHAHTGRRNDKYWGKHFSTSEGRTGMQKISGTWTLTNWKVAVVSLPKVLIKYSYMPPSVWRPIWSRDLLSGTHSITPR